MSKIFLGVDGGNSKTVALVAHADGVVMGRGRSGNGDIYADGGAQIAVANVVSAVETAIEAAGVSTEDIAHGAFRLAGVDWDEDGEFWVGHLHDQLPGLASYSVKNDGYSLLRCVDLAGVGVAVTAGTGPAVSARGRAGLEYSAGWWITEMLGGRGLGNAAFTAVVAAHLGTGPATALTEQLLIMYQLPDPAALLHAFTRHVGARPNAEKGWAARTVLQVAESGDAVARGIVDHQARDFAGHARVAAERVGLTVDRIPVPVVLGGSVLASEHPAMRDAVSRELAAVLPNADVRLTNGSPLAGALLDAMAEGGVIMSAELQTRVMQAQHPEDFLLTR